MFLQNQLTASTYNQSYTFTKFLLVLGCNCHAFCCTQLFHLHNITYALSCYSAAVGNLTSLFVTSTDVYHSLCPSSYYIALGCRDGAQTTHTLMVTPIVVFICLKSFLHESYVSLIILIKKMYNVPKSLRT